MCVCVLINNPEGRSTATTRSDAEVVALCLYSQRWFNIVITAVTDPYEFRVWFYRFQRYYGWF